MRLAWEKREQKAQVTLISAIIPVLNEAIALPATLASVQQCPAVEIIVVDGGSTDATVAIATAAGVRVLHSSDGRAAQMNAGAAIAQGEILLFLHGDTLLPPDYAPLIQAALASPAVVGGAFKLAIAGKTPSLALVAWGVNRRSQWLGLPYGDQGLFVRAAVFRQMEGFPALPIMEDFVFVQSLKRQGQIAIAPAAVLTSNRRWQKLGVLQTTLINQIMIMGYYLGVPPQRLAQWYRRRK